MPRFSYELCIPDILAHIDWSSWKTSLDQHALHRHFEAGGVVKINSKASFSPIFWEFWDFINDKKRKTKLNIWRMTDDIVGPRKLGRRGQGQHNTGQVASDNKALSWWLMVPLRAILQCDCPSPWQGLAQGFHSNLAELTFAELFDRDRGIWGVDAFHLPHSRRAPTPTGISFLRIDFKIFPIFDRLGGTLGGSLQGTHAKNSLSW